MAVQLGLAFVPTLAPERLPSLAASAERSGLDELWVWEDCFKQSGIASAAVALTVTSRIRVGIGLLPVPLRNVALTAMEFATLARIAPGRLIAGIGHGVQPWMAQAGAKVDSPLTLLREHAVALRRLLDGEEVTVDGRYVRLDGVRLEWPPTAPLPLMIGGGRPKTLALTGELGDGTLLAAAMSVDEVVEAHRHAVEARPGDASGVHPVVAALIVATGDGGRERVERELRVWRHDGAEAPGATVAGDAQQIAEAVRRLEQAGATTVVFQPTVDEPDLDGLIGVLGREVRDALGG